MPDTAPGSLPSPHRRSAAELARAIARRELSAREATEAALGRVRALDGRLGCFLRLDQEGARRRAEEIDADLAAGQPLGPLAGVPIGVKDIFLTAGLETTCASRILAGFVPPCDATVVARLRQAGAVILGKLNMDEFAMGSSNESSAFGPVRNPWDLSRVPGGSSGGSAAAVAAGLCAAALGTDTGGSIRQPAALCGVVGLKPTYGRVSRSGLIAFASSLDQAGTLTRNVEDAALLLEVIAGHDPLDSTSLDLPVPDYREQLAQARGRDLGGLRLGVPEEYFGSGVDPEVEARVRQAIAELGRLGAEIVPISLPHSRYAIACYYLICTAEASSNLARYDGVRYGLRTARTADPGSLPSSLFDMYCRTRAEGFGPEVKRRIMLGTYALRAGYYDAYYLRAQQVRTLIRRDFEAAFAGCEVIVTPTSPTTAFRLGERLDDPLTMYMADVLTISCNLAGLPGISLPCGLSGERLPVGLQLLGRPLGEADLLRVAAAYEQVSGWSALWPSGFEGDERGEPRASPAGGEHRAVPGEVSDRAASGGASELSAAGKVGKGVAP